LRGIDHHHGPRVLIDNNFPERTLDRLERGQDITRFGVFQRPDHDFFNVIEIFPVGKRVFIFGHNKDDVVADFVGQLVRNDQDIEGILDLDVAQKQGRTALDIFACHNVEASLGREKFEDIHDVNVAKIEENNFLKAFAEIRRKVHRRPVRGLGIFRPLHGIRIFRPPPGSRIFLLLQKSGVFRRFQFFFLGKNDGHRHQETSHKESRKLSVLCDVLHRVS